MNGLVATLDDYGKPAWIGAMVVGFIVFWPVGLAILAYLYWSGRMGCGGRMSGFGRWRRGTGDRWDRTVERWGQELRGAPSSGNAAFDEYREETIRRLQDEQREFQEFLERLRKAKDKAEFDQFMSERRARPASGATGEGPVATA
ncbi:DUF2852 domain-containing protein [Hyphomicrobium sulfonivorans]|uniref:DUF2852 domain-containing protein n=1 Tax=Hyphomicrobium sulfonivorans TaxID=121290 RepID=UPI00156DB22B|nr:DUF2852 domain-containing protein [Hyphomicrobium sulfonivorans]MBI1648954.1 DUF2852 domain-containing protein [Hyphomicrobium sulfonivorans]NSL70511.1 hypothetical protein [Hyphomicrobium sulfonivorans]